MRVTFTLAVVLALLAACGGGGGGDRQSPVEHAAAICAATPDASAASVAWPDITEASGLASSRIDDGLLWVHNDSGDSARVFAIDRQGALRSVYTLAGAEALDWEDMAAGPGPESGVDYLYLADIGDNAAQRAEIVVYRVREPQVGGGDTPVPEVELTGVETLTLGYPDRAHDAETLLVDPISGDLVIVTKELATGVSLVFHAPAPFDANAPVTLEQAGQIDFRSFVSSVTPPADAPALVAGVPFLPTAGDVSPTGDLIAIRTYGTVWVWSRDEGTSLADAFAAAPCEAPSAIEPQGETIALDPDGKGYTTVSEGANPPLHHFVVK